MRLALTLIGVTLISALACLSPASAQGATIVARGDFDGDGRPDTVETARIGDVLEELVPGDEAMRPVARDRAELNRTGDQVAIAVRLAARPKRLYLLMSSARSSVEACEIRVNPPGEYAADNVNGRQVLLAKNDIVAILCLNATGPGVLLKYWSKEEGGGFPGAWLPN